MADRAAADRALANRAVADGAAADRAVAAPGGRRRRQGSRGNRLLVVLAAVLGVVAIAAGAYTVRSYVVQQGYPKDMRGKPVILPQRPKAVLEKTNAVSQTNGMRLRIPATGLDVPLGELNEVDGVIDPPGFASAYLVRNYGAHLAEAGNGTVFVVMHSCRGGAVCPGNYLINVQAGAASVPTGADVYLGGLHYRVTGWKKVYKPDIRTDTEVWANTPQRLVLFTCLQVPAQTKSIDNMVITAQLVGGPGS